jgi:hypothetical protein
MRAVVVVAVIAIAVAIVKPWGAGLARQAANPTSTSPVVTRAPFVPDAPRGYDPRLFGNYEIEPAWELWPAGYVYQFGISGPLTLDEDGPSPIPSAPVPSAEAGSAGSPPPRLPPSPPAAPPPGAAELVDLGAADHLVVLALNTPAGTRVLDARLWWFPPEATPARVPLVEVPPPWSVDYFHVFGIPVRDDPAELAAWRPGIYRLDILVDPGIAVRRIGILVRPPLERRSAKDRPDGAGPTGPSSTRDPDRAEVHVAAGIIGFGVPAVGLWAIEIPEPQAPCGLAELWLAEADRPGGRCGAIVVEQVSVITLNLGSEQPIRTINLDQVDPVAGPVAIAQRPEPGYPGMVVETLDGDILGSGTYRVTATLVNGERRGWYVRVP